MADVNVILLADVIAIVLYGRCYNHQAGWYSLLFSKVANVVAILLCVADVMPTKLSCCNCYVTDVIVRVADGIAYQGG